MPDRQCCGTGGAVTKLPAGAGVVITNYDSGSGSLEDILCKKSWLHQCKKKALKSKKVIFKVYYLKLSLIKRNLNKCRKNVLVGAGATIRIYSSSTFLIVTQVYRPS
jgi:hypothetical protein